MAALEEIEVKLREMRSLATYARDNYLNREMAREFNARLRVLQREINALDEQTRGYSGWTASNAPHVSKRGYYHQKNIQPLT